MKVTGTILELVTIENRDIRIFGAPGARLSASVVGPLLHVTGSSKVAVHDMTLVGALGNPQGSGIFLEHTMSPYWPSLSLERVIVRNSRFVGIRASGYTKLSVSNSIVVANSGGGAVLYGEFEIRNSLFVRNGSASSQFGGLWISPDHACNCVFEFNTVADNVMGNAGDDGLACGAMKSPSNNIIVNDKVGSYCTPEYSLLDPGGGPASTNQFGPADFKNTMVLDPLPADFYRIPPTSAAVNKADPSSTMSTDIDGDARPAGSADIGADEVP